MDPFLRNIIQNPKLFLFLKDEFHSFDKPKKKTQVVVRKRVDVSNWPTQEISKALIRANRPRVLDRKE
jgi:hypothetical protein